MSKTDPIPGPDVDFDIFQSDVVLTLTTNSVAWGIPAGTIAELAAQQLLWTPAWNKAKDKGNRSRQDVEQKNVVRGGYEPVLRNAIQQFVQYNKLVPDSARVSMGIKPRDTVRTRVPVPDTVPQVDILPGNGNVLLVNFRQQPGAPGTGSRGKPDGVVRCNLRYKMGGTAPASVSECPLIASGTRSPITLTFSGSDAGTRIYVYAQWENSRAEGGPWTPTSVNAVVPG
jgi:hypothetical protein